MSAMDESRNYLKQMEVEKKKYMKLELANESMKEKNSELTSRLKQLQKVNENLKQEIFVCRSKITDNEVSSDKMNQYLEIALESCRSENEALKRTKGELQKSLDQFMEMNRQSHDNNRTLTEQIGKYKEEIGLLVEIKEQL